MSTLLDGRADPTIGGNGMTPLNIARATGSPGFWGSEGAQKVWFWFGRGTGWDEAGVSGSIPLVQLLLRHVGLRWPISAA